MGGGEVQGPDCNGNVTDPPRLFRERQGGGGIWPGWVASFRAEHHFFPYSSLYYTIIICLFIIFIAFLYGGGGGRLGFSVGRNGAIGYRA